MENKKITVISAGGQFTGTIATTLAHMGLPLISVVSDTNKISKEELIKESSKPLQDAREKLFKEVNKLTPHAYEKERQKALLGYGKVSGILKSRSHTPALRDTEQLIEVNPSGSKYASCTSMRNVDADRLDERRFILEFLSNMPLDFLKRSVDFRVIGGNTTPSNQREAEKIREFRASGMVEVRMEVDTKNVKRTLRYF